MYPAGASNMPSRERAIHDDRLRLPTQRERWPLHERVRSGYLAMAAEDPDRWRVVDAARSLEQLVDDVSQALADLLTPAWSEPDGSPVRTG